jgi:hypothetical protein
MKNGPERPAGQFRRAQKNVHCRCKDRGPYLKSFARVAQGSLRRRDARPFRRQRYVGAHLGRSAATLQPSQFHFVGADAPDCAVLTSDPNSRRHVLARRPGPESDPSSRQGGDRAPPLWHVDTLGDPRSFPSSQSPSTMRTPRLCSGLSAERRKRRGWVRISAATGNRRCPGGGSCRAPGQSAPPGSCRRSG